MPNLSTKDRIELVLSYGSGSLREVVDRFNNKHPDKNVTHSALSKLIAKFKETGSIHDKPCSGPSKTVTDKDTSINVLAALAKSPTKSTRRLSQEMDISRTSIQRILHANKWIPYKIQLLHHLSEDDPDRRIEFCEWAVDQFAHDESLPSKILFSDEANFYTNGEVNRQNFRYWSDQNPQAFLDCKMQGASKVMVWCGILDTRIIGPIFIEGNLTSEKYLKMLQEDVVPALMMPDADYPRYFQQDGAPPHYGKIVRNWLDVQFANKWIGHRGPVEWPPRSPDLSSLDFYLWGHVKSLVYNEKVRDEAHLIERIIHACRQVEPEVLRKVAADWKKRIYLCLESNGQHIEHMLL